MAFPRWPEKAIFTYCPELILSGKANPQVAYQQLPAIKWLHSGRLEVLKIKVRISQSCCLERLNTGQESPLMSHNRKQSLILCCLCVFQRADHQYPKLDFTQEELQERFKHQLSMEQACTVTIDSVEAAKPVTENMAKMVNKSTCCLSSSSSRYTRLLKM